jgi:beta-lactam-binding protein with PASTA domain
MEAMKLISDNKLKVGSITPSNGTNVIDEVIRQIPEAGLDVQEGTEIDIFFEELKVQEKKLIDHNVMLVNEEQYGNKVSVIVEVIPSETGDSEYY